MNVEILEASVEFVEQAFVVPLIISTGAITEITEARAAVRVRVEGREATGRGSIYLSDLWAWPGTDLSHAVRDRAMRAYSEKVAAHPDHFFGPPAHPLEMGLHLHHAVIHDQDADPPPLARSVSVSPLDAALHDAVGRAFGISAFRFYDDDAPIPSGDHYFPGEGAVAAIRAMLRGPQNGLDAWLVVGKDDALPESLAPWVHGRGYRAFKIKILGKDNAADVDRTIAIYRATKALGVAAPRLAVDSNCVNPDADSVADFLDRLAFAAPDAFAALEYVEQPTARDILRNPFAWRPVTARKPVILDEGLVDFDALQAAEAQGWSGIALKTCKGHSFTLAAAAWARRHAMFLALQDLTNPGLSAIHAFLVAAHLPVTNGVELNSPQFTPAANADWLPRLEGLFAPTDGRHRLPDLTPVGLGTDL